MNVHRHYIFFPPFLSAFLFPPVSLTHLLSGTVAGPGCIESNSRSERLKASRIGMWDSECFCSVATLDLFFFFLTIELGKGFYKWEQIVKGSRYQRCITRFPASKNVDNTILIILLEETPEKPYTLIRVWRKFKKYMTLQWTCLYLTPSWAGWARHRLHRGE